MAQESRGCAGVSLPPGEREPVWLVPGYNQSSQVPNTGGQDGTGMTLHEGSLAGGSESSSKKQAVAKIEAVARALSPRRRAAQASGWTPVV